MSDTKDRSNVVPADVRVFVRERALTASSPWHSTAQILLSILIAVGSVVAGMAIDRWWAWPPIWAISGLSFLGALAGVHEAIHGSLYRSKLANDAAGIAFGIAVLTPYASYRSYHFQHHVHTHEAGDAEPIFRLNSAIAYAVSVVFTAAGLIVMLWVEQIRILIGRPPAYARRTGRRGLAVVNTLLMVGVWVPIVLWAINEPLLVFKLLWAPMLVGYWYSSLMMSTEHYNCEFGPASAFVTSRSFEALGVLKMSMWNANYHAAHHLCPTVTGRNLGVLHEHIRDRCKNVGTSYLKFHFGIMRSILQSNYGPEIPSAIAHPDGMLIGSIESKDAADPLGYAERAGQR